MERSPLLTLSIQPSLGLPIYRQIMDAVRDQIAAGTLVAGDQLPSIRELAGHLRINPASAVKAYNELRHQGIIEQDHGRGTFVSAQASTSQTRDTLLRGEFDKLLQKATLLGLSPAEALAFFRGCIDAAELGDDHGI